MRFEIFSGIALYSILLYILLSTTAILSIVDINNEVRVSFIGVLNRTLAISLIVPQLVMPILSWIHLKRMQKYFDLWFAFQVIRQLTLIFCILFQYLTKLTSLFLHRQNLKKSLKLVFLRCQISSHQHGKSLLIILEQESLSSWHCHII